MTWNDRIKKRRLRQICNQIGPRDFSNPLLLAGLGLSNFCFLPCGDTLLDQPLIRLHFWKPLVTRIVIRVKLLLTETTSYAILKIQRPSLERVAIRSERTPTIRLLIKGLGGFQGDFLVRVRAYAIGIVIRSFRLCALQSSPDGTKVIQLLNTTILAVLLQLRFCKLSLRNLCV